MLEHNQNFVSSYIIPPCLLQTSPLIPAASVVVACYIQSVSSLFSTCPNHLSIAILLTLQTGPRLIVLWAPGVFSYDVVSTHWKQSMQWF